MLVELLLVPNCPHADTTRAALTQCPDDLGRPITVVERVGDYPSPTILINGVDVMTGTTATPHTPACRLDQPTPQRLLAALRSHETAGKTGGAGPACGPLDITDRPMRG
jgi:hypothetical protein